MSTKAEPVPESAEDLAERFADLVARCDQDNRHSSKLQTTMEHAAFREVVAMGEKAVPLLLASIEKGSSTWTLVLALGEITGVDWIAWGREQGYRW